MSSCVCKVYSQQSTIDALPSLRWELFRKKNLEGEKLPLTRGTLIPHILRASNMSQRDKSYITAKPVLPALEHNGWKKSIPKGEYLPVMCFKEPAPKAVLELVKCDVKAIVTLQTALAWEMVFRALLCVKCTNCWNVQKSNLCEDLNDINMWIINNQSILCFPNHAHETNIFTGFV